MDYGRNHPWESLERSAFIHPLSIRSETIHHVGDVPEGVGVRQDSLLSLRSSRSSSGLLLLETKVF